MSTNPQKRKQENGSDSDGGSSVSVEIEPPPKKKKAVQSGGGFWKNALLASANDPKFKVFEDERVIVIKDKYPKARYHFLVLPKEEKIDNLHQLTEKHIGLLERMKEAGREVAAENGLLDNFRFGFHAKPSMSCLHMHVISRDYDSPCLKTKQHWNSFTSDFFCDVDTVLNNLKRDGRVAVMSANEIERLLKQPLKCHLCKDEKTFPTMPKLKDHLKKHQTKNPQ